MRARELMALHPEAAELLAFYIRLVEFQKSGAKRLPDDLRRGPADWEQRVLGQREAERQASIAGKCDACGTRPVAAVLRGEGEGGKRSLVCSMCSSEWESRRILCPNCGEEDKEKLPVFSSEERQFDYIRIEACDSCRTYLKSIDMTKNGLAIPIVDEIASVTLNVWAEEHGYTKIEPNLLGL